MGSVGTGSYLTACDSGPGSGPCQAPSTSSLVSGNPIASLLLGTGDVSSTINVLPAMSQYAFGGYVQDQ